MAEQYTNSIPVERVREVFDYNPLTGNLHWKVRASKNTKLGSVPGCTSNGYKIVRFDKQLYRQHRVIWAWVTGESDPPLLDHRDRDRSNNRFWNLRPASIAENNMNRAAAGVTCRSSDGRWIAQIGAGWKHFYLGTYGTEAEARAAYAGAAVVLHGEFACTE